MVSITSFIATLASITALTNGFQLQVRRSGYEHHLSSVSISSDFRLVLDPQNEPTDFKANDGELLVSASGVRVLVNDSDGTAIVGNVITIPGKYSSQGFSDETGSYLFNGKGAWIQKEDNGISVLHWDNRTISDKRAVPVSIVPV